MNKHTFEITGSGQFNAQVLLSTLYVPV